jgi:hypothetical protein
MLVIKGQVVQGCNHFQQRMTNFRTVFRDSVGEELFPGTLNVKVDSEMPINEHFRIRGATIGEPNQDLLFEICRANGLWAYRIRPYNLQDGTGGHGDDTLEIACRQEIRNANPGSFVEVAFFRNDIDKAIFGFPDFADIVFAAHGPALRLTFAHSLLANDLLAKLPKTAKADDAVIYMLVRMTVNGWVELLTLVGHGAGLGAMKIARGMFETSVMAEYLRQTPAEIQDYIEYGPILMYKRMKQWPDAVTTEETARVEKAYNRVRSRFEHKGKVRGQWNNHPISQMASKIGRKDQYDKIYSLMASIHHGNFEAMIAHLSGSASLDIEQPPSLAWIKQALLSGHVYLLQALDTLNDKFNLGFEEQLRLAGEEFTQVWRSP